MMWTATLGRYLATPRPASKFPDRPHNPRPARGSDRPAIEVPGDRPGVTRGEHGDFPELMGI